MDRLQVQLIICLDRDEAHVLAVHNFDKRFGIQEVVLVGLHNGFTN